MAEFLAVTGSLLFVLIGLGFCIFSHELGHFLVARRLGLHVDAFSLGFRPFWRKKINGVEYRLGYLPFGGYVELPQIDATDAVPHAADGSELRRARPYERVLTAAAGPLFNVISGMLLGCIIWIVGMPQDSPKMREITVLEIQKESPEYEAGLRIGDRIVKVNGKPFFATWTGFVSELFYTLGKIEFEVIRDGRTLKVAYTPKVNPNAPGSLKNEKIAYPFFTPMIPIELVPKPGSPAEKAGIRQGDAAIRMNGQPLTDFIAFQSGIDQAGANPLILTLRGRDGKLRDVTVTPEPVPGLPEEFNRYLIGVLFGVEKERSGIRVMAVMPNSPALAAGMRKGDEILSINGSVIKEPGDVPKLISQNKEQPSRITLKRDGRELVITVAARKVSPHTIGAELTLRDHPTPVQLFMTVWNGSYKALRGIVVSIGHKIGMTEQTSSISPRHMSGPLGIGLVLFRSVYSSSLISGIYFIVFISFALAIFNLLPLPVLDGGHIFFGLIEIIFRRALPETFMKVISNIFVALLIALMLYVTFFDGQRIWHLVAPQKTAQGGTPNAPQK